MKRVISLLLSSAALLASSHSFAASFVYTGSEITGINGINVNGTLYNATFHNDISWYSKDLYSTSFAGQASASLVALFDVGGDFQGSDQDLYQPAFQKFVGVEDYNYFMNFNTLANTVNVAGTDVTYMFQFQNYYFGLDYADKSVGPIQHSTLQDNISTYVEWNEATSVSAVPVPAAAWLFFPAMAGLLGFRRKANKA